MKELTFRSTGHPFIDRVWGGWPCGSVVELYGPEGCGKTTLALDACAAATDRGQRVAYWDVENRLWGGRVRERGVNTGKLAYSDETQAETVWEGVLAQAASRDVQVIVVDTATALAAKATQEEGVQGYGYNVDIQNRVMELALKLIMPELRASGATLFVINQMRQAVGLTFGPSAVPTSSDALKHFAAMRVDMRRTEAMKGPVPAGEDMPSIVGVKIKCQLVKNSAGNPYQQVEYSLKF